MKHASSEEKEQMGESLDIENFEKRVKNNAGLLNIGDNKFNKFEFMLIIRYLSKLTHFDKNKKHIADPGAKFPLNQQMVKFVRDRKVPLVHIKVNEAEIKRRLKKNYDQFLFWESLGMPEDVDKGLRSNHIRAINQLRKNTQKKPSKEEELNTLFNYYEELESQRQPVYEKVADFSIQVKEDESIEQVLTKILQAFVLFNIQKEFSRKPKHKNPYEWLDLAVEQKKAEKVEGQKTKMSPYI